MVLHSIVGAPRQQLGNDCEEQGGPAVRSIPSIWLGPGWASRSIAEAEQVAGRDLSLRRNQAAPFPEFVNLT